MSTAPEFKRANKITVHFEAGIAVATLYRTHEKLSVVRSDNPLCLTNGFVLPEKKMDGEKEVEVSGAEKLAAFKDFVTANSSLFGITYDPIDRRDDSNKYPSSYNDANLIPTAEQVLADQLKRIIPSLQTAVDKFVTDGHLAAPGTVEMSLGNSSATVSEKYAKGNIKYADVIVPVIITVGDKSCTTDVTMNLVSGQIKKAREFGKDTAFTMTGIKSIMIGAGLLPKIEKPVKAPKTDGAEGTPASEPAAI